MQHVLRTLMVAATVAFPGVSACGPGDKAPPAGALAGPPPTAEFKSTVDSSKLIYVTPVEGITTAARLVLADAIAAALRDAKKPAVLADRTNDMGPTVAGRIVEVQERGSVLWVTAAWALKAPYGTPVAEYRHQIVVDKTLWQTGAPEAINLVVADAGPMVAGMVKEYVSPVAMAAVPETTPSPPPTPALASEQKPVPAATPPPAVAAMPEPAKRITPPPAGDKAAATDEAAAPAKPQVRPKTIPRRPARGPTALTEKRPEAPVETAALETQKPSAAPKEAAEKPATGRPMLLNRGPPPKQPPAKPADDGPRKTSKPVLLPVPGEGAGIVPDPPPVAWSKPSFLIKAVEGAPGDGNLALMRAMKAALRKRDLTVTEDPRQAGFVISGRVQVGPAINGRQQARIVWAVNTVTGEEVGKAVQENAVAAGSLDGPWGRLAEIVSTAAVTGIQELFGVGDKQSSRLDLPPVPPAPKLPREPGRAPPPFN